MQVPWQRYIENVLDLQKKKQALEDTCKGLVKLVKNLLAKSHSYVL